MARVMRYDGIPTTRTVREVLGLSGWRAPLRNESWERMPVHLRRERTVVDPIYVVPQMLPCPECGGMGKVNGGVVSGLVDCERCCGSGVVAPPKPDYIATPGWRGFDPDHRPPFGPWRPMPESIDDGVWVGRQDGQVVAYKVTAIDPLPAIDSDSATDDTPSPCVAVGEDFVSLWEGRSTTPLADEPWAASLRPGQVVWRLHLEALDQPYTRMVAQWGNGSPLHDVVDAAVPLSVPVGEVIDVELA